MESSIQLKEHLKNFVFEDGISRKLDALFELAEKRKKCGFEKWLQFELVLSFREKGFNALPEDKALSDKSKSDKSHFLTDIVIRSNSRCSLRLELKVRRRAKYAILALLSDIKKLGKTIDSDESSDESSVNFAVVLCQEDVGEKSMEKLSMDWPNFCFNFIEAGKVYFLIAEARAR